MDIELEKLKKLEHALCDAIDILRDWQAEEAKPEEEKWIAYLARYQDGQDVLTLCCCDESYWVTAKKFDGAKTKLFVGTEEECVEWIKAREKFVEVIKAWEDGKTIQVYEALFKKWADCAGTLEWYTDCEYRVKPECPCEDGIDSKVWGSEQSEGGKKEYRPYESPAEMIADLQKENAELTCQVKRNIYCYSCAKADERCFRKEIGCPCGKYKSYKDENAELKEKLKPENCLKLLAKDGYIKFTSDQLTKAKKIIKELLDFDFLPENEIKKQAEQFLDEVKE